MQGVHYQGELESPVGKTSFGYFDRDPAFIEDAPKVADYIARRLGWPTVDIEIDQSDLYNAFEEAILEFSSKVNNLNIEDNLVLLQGNEKIGEFADLTDKHVTGTPLREAIRLSKAYGSEVGHGGSVDWYKEYIDLEPGVQDYDIEELLQARRSSSMPRRNIVIKTVYHYPPPASERYSVYGSGYAYGGGVFGEFKGDSSLDLDPDTLDAAYGTDRHLLYPAYEDLLRIQSVEFHDQIRRSQYSYILRNKQIRIFPVPRWPTKLWFEFAYEDELDDAQVVAGDIADVVSDYSNAPMYVKPYRKMNGPSKRWIYQYALAVAMHKLGVARSKFGGATPTPNDQFQLDGQEMRSEGQQMMERLEDDLEERLQRLTRSEMMQRKVEEQQSMMELFKNTPMGIYIA